MFTTLAPAMEELVEEEREDFEERMLPRDDGDEVDEWREEGCEIYPERVG